jgi:hypothetical protein
VRLQGPSCQGALLLGAHPECSCPTEYTCIVHLTGRYAASPQLLTEKLKNSITGGFADSRMSCLSANSGLILDSGKSNLLVDDNLGVLSQEQEHPEPPATEPSEHITTVDADNMDEESLQEVVGLLSHLEASSRTEVRKQNMHPCAGQH